MQLTELRGVGETLAKKFRILGIFSAQELVDAVPRRYDDYSEITSVSKIKPGLVTLKIRFGTPTQRYSRGGLHMTEALASDETGSVKVTWFNQRYRAQSLKVGEEYYLSGEFSPNHRYFSIVNPTIELAKSFPLHTARMVPVYRTTKGLGIAQIRKAVRSALDTLQFEETLPSWLLKQEQLMLRKEALEQMHFPSSKEKLQEARKRLGFEEVFQLTLASELNKAERSKEKSLSIALNEEAVASFVDSLPFKLTNDQRKAAWEILQDMEGDTPMNRLLEGDVGSGKTLVAAIAALNTSMQGFQTAFMAPTELLARQHAESLQKHFSSHDSPPEIEFLSGSMSKGDRRHPLERIESGVAQIIIGTHALFQESVTFHDLALVVVDEQHRFGVDQRKALQSKAKKMPHVLHMTATPIPRSLALTLYGELDVSRIEELPPGRQPIGTHVIIPEQREKLYKKLAEHCQGSKEQLYIVCPQIDEGVSKRANATTLHDELSKKWLKSLKIGLLHGRMKADEKERVMREFSAGQLDAIVATTVIEVGVDVPNATTMIIESADSFGLAQLHQLRGRVGRGSKQSRCYLVLSENDAPKKRLQLLSNETNGFVLAEYDLDERGPGAIYGRMQSGALDLRVAKLSDRALIKSAKAAAQQYITRGDDLLEYKQLHSRVSELRKIVNLN